MASDDQQFRRIIDHAQDYAIFTLSPEAVITTWSRGAERIFQYSAGEAVGQNASMIFTPEDQTLGEHERELAIAATEGRAEDERWHVRRDGSRLWASGILNGIRNEVGVIDGFLKIVRDKTNDKRLQESRRNRNRAPRYTGVRARKRDVLCAHRALARRNNGPFGRDAGDLGRSKATPRCPRPARHRCRT
jgi:PAS domain S-box-containing protein